MTQIQEEKAIEATKLAAAAEATAAADADRIAKEDADKADKARVDRAEKAELALQAQEAAPAVAEVTPTSVANEINVLPMHDIVEKNDDVYIYENIQLPATFAGEKGVKKFVGTNGQVIYYTPVLVKKFSDNVVTDGASEEAIDE